MPEIHGLLLAVLTSFTLLAGASDAVPPSPPSDGLTEARIVAASRGFAVGEVHSGRTTYVFFDTESFKSGALWSVSKPLWPQMRFVWIPVAVIDDRSLAQGAAILAAQSPSEALSAHENTRATLHQRQRAALPVSPLSAPTLAVLGNTALFRANGHSRVPLTATASPQGLVTASPEVLTTPELARILGLEYPESP